MDCRIDLPVAAPITISMQFLSSLLALAGAFVVVGAYDLRELYSFSGGDGVAFCKSWKCNWWAPLSIVLDAVDHG